MSFDRPASATTGWQLPSHSQCLPLSTLFHPLKQENNLSLFLRLFFNVVWEFICVFLLYCLVRMGEGRFSRKVPNSTTNAIDTNMHWTRSAVALGILIVVLTYCAADGEVAQHPHDAELHPLAQKSFPKPHDTSYVKRHPKTPSGLRVSARDYSVTSHIHRKRQELASQAATTEEDRERKEHHLAQLRRHPVPLAFCDDINEAGLVEKLERDIQGEGVTAHRHAKNSHNKVGRVGAHESAVTVSEAMHQFAKEETIKIRDLKDKIQKTRLLKDVPEGEDFFDPVERECERFLSKDVPAEFRKHLAVADVPEGDALFGFMDGSKQRAVLTEVLSHLKNYFHGHLLDGESHQDRKHRFLVSKGPLQELYAHFNRSLTIADGMKATYLDGAWLQFPFWRAHSSHFTKEHNIKALHEDGHVVKPKPEDAGQNVTCEGVLQFTRHRNLLINAVSNHASKAVMWLKHECHDDGHGGEL